MKKILLTFLLSIVAIFAVIIADTTWAIEVIPPPSTNISLPDINSDPGNAIASIIKYFILITGILAVMAITWGGIKFILSTGDDEKMKKARYTIIYAFVGVVVAGLAYSLVEIITKVNIPGN